MRKGGIIYEIEEGQGEIDEQDVEEEKDEEKGWMKCKKQIARKVGAADERKRVCSSLT